MGALKHPSARSKGLVAPEETDSDGLDARRPQMRRCEQFTQVSPSLLTVLGQTVSLAYRGVPLREA
jgi:hypothetical protein